MSQLELKGLTQKDHNAISEAWASNLTYNNDDLFEDYMKFLEWLETDDNCSNLKPAHWTETAEDEEGDEYIEDVSRELQESYLGYIPSLDTFVTGFDMWEGDNDNPAGIALWKLSNHNFELVSEDIDYCSTMIYGRNGAYKKLHKKYSDLIDIRLD